MNISKKTYLWIVGIFAALILIIIGVAVKFLLFDTPPDTAAPQTQQRESVSSFPSAPSRSPQNPTTNVPILNQSYLTGRHVVVFKDGVSLTQGREIIEELGGKIILELPLSRAFTVEISDADRKKLESHPNIKFIEPDAFAEPLYFYNRALAQIVSEGTKANIYIIDSGAAAAEGVYASTKSVVPGTTPVDDTPLGHGVGVSFTAHDFAQRSGLGENVNIHSIRIADGNGDATSATLAEGIRESVRSGADSINISYFGNVPTQNVHEALNEAERAGIPVIVSAGNFADQKGINEFLIHSNVISVGALNSGLPADYTDGLVPGNIADVFAEGNDSSLPGDMGTSFAAPRIAVLAGVLKKSQIDSGSDLNGDGTWNTQEIKLKLQEGARTGKYSSIQDGLGVFETYATAPGFRDPSAEEFGDDFSFFDSVDFNEDELAPFGGFGAPVVRDPNDFSYTLDNYFGDFDPNVSDFSFDQTIGAVGGRRIVSGSEAFIPGDPRFDTTVRIISGTEGVIPGITESLSDLGNFGGEGFIPGDARFPTEVDLGGASVFQDFTPGAPGVSVAGSLGDLGSQIVGGLNDVVNSALGALGIPGIDIGPIVGIAGQVLPGVLSGNLGGAVSGILSNVLGGSSAGGALSGILGGNLGGLSGVLSLAGGLFGGGAHVPVKDFVQISLQEKLVAKEYNLDSVAYLASKTTIRGVLGNVLNWINTGNDGNPYYVTNPIDYFRGVENQTTNVFLGEIARLNLSPNIQRSIALGASIAAANNFKQRITPTISIGQQNAFLQDFNNGGWQTWLYMLQSRNNPLGQYRLAAEELDRRQREAELRQAQELAWGRGYQPATVCIAKDFLGNCVRTEIVTPGAFIESQQAAVFSSIIRQLEADDELGEVTSSLLSNMIAQILGGRPTGLRGFSSAAIVSPAADAPAVNRTKEGLQEAIRVMLEPEVTYNVTKSASLISLNDARQTLETLLSVRTYFNETEPLKTRLTQSTELALAIEGNRSYATTTIQNTIEPALKTLAGEIRASTQSIGRIQALVQELAPINTPQGLLLISDKYLDLSRRTRTRADADTAQQEFTTLNGLAQNMIADTASRFASEQAIIQKIKNELFPPPSNN